MFYIIFLILVAIFAIQIMFELGILLYALGAIASWAFVAWSMRFKFWRWSLIVALPVTSWALANVAAKLVEYVSYVLYNA